MALWVELWLGAEPQLHPWTLPCALHAPAATRARKSPSMATHGSTKALTAARGNSARASGRTGAWAGRFCPCTQKDSCAPPVAASVPGSAVCVPVHTHRSKSNVDEPLRWLRRYVRYFMSRIETLLSCGVTPVVVFDGCPLPMKSEENETRRRCGWTLSC